MIHDPLSHRHIILFPLPGPFLDNPRATPLTMPFLLIRPFLILITPSITTINDTPTFYHTKPGPFLNFIQRNTGWLLQVKGNREKDVFIDTVFSGTSIQVIIDWFDWAIQNNLTHAPSDFDSRSSLVFTFDWAIWLGLILQWAYNAINPKLGAAKADVWRYAVMWCYGGFYMDYDR